MKLLAWLVFTVLVIIYQLSNKALASRFGKQSSRRVEIAFGVLWAAVNAMGVWALLTFLDAQFSVFDRIGRAFWDNAAAQTQQEDPERSVEQMESPREPLPRQTVRIRRTQAQPSNMQKPNDDLQTEQMESGVASNGDVYVELVDVTRPVSEPDDRPDYKLYRVATEAYVIRHDFGPAVIRNGPGEGYDVIARMSGGRCVLVDGVSGAWSAIGGAVPGEGRAFIETELLLPGNDSNQC